MNNRGFTLIETIIYIALFSLLMTGAVLTVFNLIDATASTNTKTATADEGTFVLRKLSWALTGYTSASLGGSGCNMTLSVNLKGYGNNPIEFQRNAANNTIEMREGGSGSFTAITTSNVDASCLEFALQSGTPAGIAATTTIDAQDFALTRYQRQ